MGIYNKDCILAKDSISMRKRVRRYSRSAPLSREHGGEGEEEFVGESRPMSKHSYAARVHSDGESWGRA